MVARDDKVNTPPGIRPPATANISQPLDAEMNERSGYVHAVMAGGRAEMV